MLTVNADRDVVEQRLGGGELACAGTTTHPARPASAAMFTDDVSQILADLHYAKADLIGGSYGATAEQVFLLRHPDQVRTMTLMNGTLLTIPLYDRQPGNSQLALDHVFALCQSQPACHQAFPHLAADWAALWASLGRSPWVVPAAQSPTGRQSACTRTHSPTPCTRRCMPAT